MKFYQTIVPVILFIMYTAPIFGAEDTTLTNVHEKFFVPEVICKLIDEFCSETTELNDQFHEKTGHIKPHSPLLDLISFSQEGRSSLLNCTSTIATAGFLEALLKKTLSYTPMLPEINPLFRASIAIGVTTISLRTIFTLLANSHLVIKSPARARIEIKVNQENNQEEIVISDTPANNSEIYGTECRSLSDMRFIQTIQLKDEQKIYPHVRNDREYRDIFKKIRLQPVLKNGKVDIYLPNDCYKTEHKLRSLPTLKKVTTIDISKNGTIVTYGENGAHTWKLSRRKSLYEIMDTE